MKIHFNDAYQYNVLLQSGAYVYILLSLTNPDLFNFLIGYPKHFVNYFET